MYTHFGVCVHVNESVYTHVPISVLRTNKIQTEGGKLMKDSKDKLGMGKKRKERKTGKQGQLCKQDSPPKGYTAPPPQKNSFAGQLGGLVS